MRILQLISSGGFYGAENMLVNLAQALKGQACPTFVAVFHNSHRPNTEVAAEARRRGLTVEMIPCRGRADRGAVRAVRRCIETQGIDLLHTHGYKADLYGYLATRRSRVPVLATCHNWPHQSLPLRFYSVVDRLVLRHFPRIVAVSEGVRELLERFGIPKSRIAIIGNGVDLDLYARASPTLTRELPTKDRLVVGMVGRLVPRKGADHLLRAAREVLKTFPRTLFVFVGDGPARKGLEEMARDLGIEGNVTFSGQCGDMPGIYASLDLLVLPSLSEGMPMTILEALAAKKPVVATPVGAVPQVIIPEQTGLLVEAGDSLGLRDAIARLLANRELRLRLGENGQTLIRQKYSAEVMARNYLNLYRGLLEPRAA